MSRALDYLVAARPEAMEAYFSFLRESGSRLDPKTRALISVITKVGTQTEAGLKQYLPKALKAGVSAEEVIDGLLMAFPLLGLRRIVWAIDVIIEMDLPEFSLAALSEQPEWHIVGDEGSLSEAPGAGVALECDGRPLVVCPPVPADGLGWRVFDGRCPHQGTTFTVRSIDGLEMTCPGHGWRFDLRGGDCLAGRAPLRRYMEKVEDGILYVLW